jgi:carbon monoxide dehydrogenase subunit G
MEVKLDKRVPVAASPAQAWVLLSDIRATAACMPGAQITEQVDDRHFKGTVRSKIGPAVMTFNGDIHVLALEFEQQRLQMLGKGADRSGSSASMQLTAVVEPGETPDSSMLVGQAVITVSGKLAQFGSRLLVPVSDAMLAQFADNFRAAAAAVPAAGAVASAAADGAPVETAPAAQAETGMPSGAPASAAPAAARPARELDALSLVWTVISNWFAGLFGRKAP